MLSEPVGASQRAGLARSGAEKAPIAVDLDGTLIASDTLHECIWLALRHDPLLVFKAFWWWWRKGRAGLKRELAERVRPDVEHLPYREELLDWLKSEKQGGRCLVLATAADRAIAEEVANHLGIFDGVIASDRSTNLKGRDKLAALQKYVGGDFVYAGDSAADLAVWRGAQGAVLVGVPPRLRERVGDVEIEREFEVVGARAKDWIRELRLHQWIKNLLLFVPLLVSFEYDWSRIVAVSLAFLAFGLVASSTYVFNDLLDVESDRRHPRKRHRPVASGKISIAAALAVAMASLVAGAGLALIALPSAFAYWLLAYFVGTVAYSTVFKRYVVFDVVLLAGLYTLRILAGAAAFSLVLSDWLLAFSVAIFVSLALVKRCAELIALKQAGQNQARGRDYAISDLPVLLPLGIGAGVAAMLVFMLFVRDLQQGGHYASPQVLGLAAPLLLYWIARLWIKTIRGEMHDDPIVYALRDRASRLTVIALVAVVLVAHRLSWAFS